MLHHFRTNIVNDYFGDPVLLIKFFNKKRIYLFDLGDISILQIGQVLEISNIFVSHTHIDHFFGFDRVIRIHLGRNKTLHIYGPPGISTNVEGKLNGYTWNLINSYKTNNIIYVIEIHKTKILTYKYQSKKKFKRETLGSIKTRNNIILSKKKLKISSTTLNHNIPCLAFSLKERPIIKVLPDEIKSIGLTQGKWIKNLKDCFYQKRNIKKNIYNMECNNISIKLSILIKKILKITKGEKITYITDTRFDKKTVKQILKLAKKSNHLFIEATFSANHKKMAEAKYHLTTKQAGEIAKKSISKTYTIFHHSPRYKNQRKQLLKEAKKAFEKNY